MQFGPGGKNHRKSPDSDNRQGNKVKNSFL